MWRPQVERLSRAGWRVVARIPAATLAIIDGAGHLPNLERPDAFNAALESFLSSVTASDLGDDILSRHRRAE